MHGASQLRKETQRQARTRDWCAQPERARHRRHSLSTRSPGHLARGRGSVSVEAAILFALLSSLIFGIIVFGQMVYAYNWVSHAAREATRYAMVRGQASPDPCVDQSCVQTFVRQKATGIGLNPDAVAVNATWKPDSKAGSIVQVQVQYNFQVVLPLIPVSTVVLESTSEMTISQ